MMAEMAVQVQFIYYLAVFLQHTYSFEGLCHTLCSRFCTHFFSLKTLHVIFFQTVKRDRVDKFVSLLEDENWYVLCRV